MEMPVSYQLTNGKCIRLKNSQRSKSYYDSENDYYDQYDREDADEW